MTDSDPQLAAEHRRLFPALRPIEWITFGVLAGLLAATNIYSTLLIGWGDTGSIIAVLAAMMTLGALGRRPSVHTLNLGQTMASAGGSIGFAVASYAAVRIVDPDFAPSVPVQIAMFVAMGMLGSIVGATVRRSMVGYFFPSGTACAVIQRSVVGGDEAESQRPLRLLKVWGAIAMLLTIPSKISLTKVGEDAGKGVFRAIDIIKDPQGSWHAIGVDPLYYGIGIVVGPRVGLGMLLGALAGPFLIQPELADADMSAELGTWMRWVAIALLTLPTFATILFAYRFRTPPVVPPGFTPGATTYPVPARRTFVFGMVGVVMAAVTAWCAQQVFGMPWHVSIATAAIAWPLCIVNGRVTGDTDINPVRLVAIVLLSGFAWMLSGGAIALLGMAVVGGTLAAVAVDMMQDYRTGFLVDANPTHQTSVQFVGSLVGALVAIPTLSLLVGQLGIGPDSALPAPGAQVWAEMAEAMAGSTDFSGALISAIIWVSVIGCVYAFFTVYPVTAGWMPSLFGAGIGLLVGVEASAAIFVGGMIKVVAGWVATRGKTGDARQEAAEASGNDTMLIGASVFAASAILSVLLVLSKTALDAFGIELFDIAH